MLLFKLEISVQELFSFLLVFWSSQPRNSGQENNRAVESESKAAIGTTKNKDRQLDGLSNIRCLIGSYFALFMARTGPGWLTYCCHLEAAFKAHSVSWPLFA